MLFIFVSILCTWEKLKFAMSPSHPPPILLELARFCLRVVPSWIGRRGVSQLINWCFVPSQPLGIISGLKQTVIKRANKAEKRPEEQRKSYRENLCNEIQLKGP